MFGLSVPLALFGLVALQKGAGGIAVAGGIGMIGGLALTLSAPEYRPSITATAL